MDIDEFTLGKYKKLTSSRAEEQFVEDHPSALRDAEVPRSSAFTEQAWRRTRLGKYNKLISPKLEQQVQEDRPTTLHLELPRSSVSVEEDQRQTTWYTDYQLDSSGEFPSDSKRKSEDWACFRKNSPSNSLKNSKLNCSSPDISILSTKNRESKQRKSTTPPPAPQITGFVKFRNKTKKTPADSPKRSEKAFTVYGDNTVQTSPKKQRPRTSVFFHSVMRRPKNSLSTPQTSLLDTLDNKKLRTAFLDFLESEYSSENLRFWLSCEKFRKLKSEEQRFREGQNIFDEYVSPTAPHQVNIDHVTRRQITIALGSYDGITSDVFDNAQRYVFSIMENDSYPRFTNSQYYKDASGAKKNAFESVIANFFPSATSPVRPQQNKLFKNSNNNNSNNVTLYMNDSLPAKPNATVFRRFSFGFKKNYTTKPDKPNRSSAPDLSKDSFYNVQLKVV